MGTCCVEFEYTYKWDQILAEPSVDRQIEMLEANMQALEDAISNTGECVFEFPFRWYNFWEGLLAGEPWAIGIAEENDLAIEMKFGRCTCATGFTFSSSVLLGAAPTSDIEYTTPFGNGTFTLTSVYAIPGSDGPIDGAFPYVDVWKIDSGFTTQVGIVNLGFGFHEGETYVGTVLESEIQFNDTFGDLSGFYFSGQTEQTVGVTIFAEFEGGGEITTVPWVTV